MENKTIVFASSNPNKIREVNEITKDFGISFVGPDKDFYPIENGKTFIENAKIKALCASKSETRGYKYFLADDSGLCVDFLNGEPGIYSARYDETPQKRIDKLLKNLVGVEKRDAHFVCALVLCNDKNEILFETKGICEGTISQKQSGSNGFGYDPIFIPKGFEPKTMADLDENFKNQISHRALAFKEFIKNIKNL